MVEVVEVNCSSNSISMIIYAIKGMLGIIQIAGPILLIISAIIGFAKLVANPEAKNGITKIVNSFLSAIILFFIPLIVDIVMEILGSNNTLSSCWMNAEKPNFSSSYISNQEKEKKPIISSASDYEPGVSTDNGTEGSSVYSPGESIEGSAKQIGDVIWDSTDVTKISNLTSSQLVGILNAHGGNAKNFVPHAAGLITAEQKYHVNVFFLLGVEALESGWVTSNISRNCNNLGGVCESSAHPSNGCGSNSNCRFAYFPSVSQFVDYHAKMLQVNYLTPGGDFYHGKTPSAVVTDYCPGCSSWPGSVIQIANELFREVPKVL